MQAEKQPLADQAKSTSATQFPHQRIDASEEILKRLVDSEGPLTKKDLLDLILPPQQLPYTWPDVESLLGKLSDELEIIQRDANSDFDRTLPDDTQLRLDQLTANLQETQQQVLRLQCNISQTREQHHQVRILCNEKVIQTRRDAVESEKRLKKSLQESKFKQVLEFFRLFTIHLDAAVASTRLALARLAANPLQPFDWPTYHQSMYLLRACGKALIDVDKLERLYQFYQNFTAITFRNPVSQLDMNNFIEFPAMYSFETQLDVILSDGHNDITTPYGRFVSDPNIDEILHSVDMVKSELFSHSMDRLSSITKDCCRLIIDLNLNYIEAHFTNGINIDRLNGCETATNASRGVASQPLSSSDGSQPLPSYAFSPQDYITHIGQHVLTLRKQTEQFDQIDNRPLKLALDYLRFSEQDNFDARIYKSVTEIILRCIARHCIRSLIGRTAKSVLSQLTPNGKRQLGTDAMYLGNILEDLNLMNPNDESVQKFKSLTGYQ